MSLISQLADAIQRQEGWSPNSASYRNNNPGNIMDIDYYRATGQFKLQVYNSYAEGRAALENLIQRYISQGHTLQSFFEKYAPSGHGANNPSIYARNVANWLGIPTDVPLNALNTAPSSPSSVPATNTSPLPQLFGENPSPLLGIALLGGAAIVIYWLLD